ncbi:hypothetical protein U14_05013 [Candidatus Moduliflexus flocculans]|uniref:DUF1554 domain-containing protein n=1 Tax=Candidatus Moduliflexus flocculans TaxID=1499966 RepID=A0A081BQQ8_9BACT|nr:hypothetical protein U14_05013 [Candidatus Moduliflexus flocculans]
MKLNKNMTRTLLTGLVGLTLIGGLVAGCQLFDTNSSSLTAPTAETVRPENFIIGSADSDQWGGQYSKDNTYFMVNIPVTGAVKVEYTITGGATYALFVDTTTPTKWEIGLKTVDGVTDTLQSVCVTYTDGVPFASVPADATTSTQHQAAHYLRKLENGTENWWPIDAAFAFAGETKTVCVLIDGVVQGADVAGPFPKATAPVTPARDVRIFVTQSTYTGNLGGVSGANVKCQSDTNAAGLTGYTIKAIISDSSQNAKDVLPAAQQTLPVYRLDGTTQIATNWAALWNAVTTPLNNSITDTWAWIWTGTWDSGTVTPNTCANWTANSGNGEYGRPDRTDFWIREFDDSCSSNSLSLYCIAY